VRTDISSTACDENHVSPLAACSFEVSCDVKVADCDGGSREDMKLQGWFVSGVIADALSDTLHRFLI